MWIAKIFPLLLVLSASLARAETDDLRDEQQLLHRHISLGHVRLWDNNLHAFRPPLPTEAMPTAKVFVVHIWADYCTPCLKELPWLRELVPRVETSEVRFIFLTETNAPANMDKFMQKFQGELPKVDRQYQDTSEQVLKMLQFRRLPMTLLLDENLVVRQAFVGSIVPRRHELIQGIDRLLAVTKETAQAN